jgi:hypothetical protein
MLTAAIISFVVCVIALTWFAIALQRKEKQAFDRFAKGQTPFTPAEIQRMEDRTA